MTAVPEPSDAREQRHDPMWLHASQYGRWCVCSCGWQSRSGTIAFAQDEFGKHILMERRLVSTTEGDE